MNDLTDKFIESTAIGKAALIKFGEVPENFRLYLLDILKPGYVKVTGAIFREAKRGINKGKLCILVNGTKKSVIVDKRDIENV